MAERAEKAAVVLTTNLPFSEWTQVIPNARLCKALLDRITDSRSHFGDRHRVKPVPANGGKAEERSQVELTGKPWK